MNESDPNGTCVGRFGCEWQLTGVIFDMDGVLVDSHALHRKAWRLFLNTLGRQVNDAELDFILDGRKREEILKHFLGTCSERQMEDYGRRKDTIFRQIQLLTVPIPGAVACVRSLHRRRVATAVATSASRSRARATLIELGIWDCFEVVVTGEDVLQGKPDPAVYRCACERLQIEAQYLVAVEDAVSGVRAAHAAGLRCLAIDSHETPEKLIAAGAFHTVRSLEKVDFTALESMVRCDRLSAGVPRSANALNA